VRRIAFLLACYDRYIKIGKDDNRRPVPAAGAQCGASARANHREQLAMTLLECADLVGARPAKDTRFAAQYLACRAKLDTDGVRATLIGLRDMVV